MDRDDLIINAISELKEEQRATRQEISAMNKAIASLASYHQRLNNLEESVKELPKIKIVVNALVWVVTAVTGGAIITLIRTTVGQ